MVFFAHSTEDPTEKDWQLLSDHLINVAKMAADFAQYFGAQEIAYHMGLLHDFGKYSEPYQARLRGGPRVDHSTAGAKLAVEKYPQLGWLMAFCIAGHHAGLANGLREGELTTLAQRLENIIPALDKAWQDEIPLADKLSFPAITPSKTEQFFSLSFFTRMLYSCLVDADFLETEAFYAKGQNVSVERGNYPDLITLQHHFNQFIQSKFRQSSANQKVSSLNQLRSQIFDYAVQQAALPPGLFTLTVPTGGGKTFTSMAFALEHAKIHQLRRIIYVIPFTSIIEQNAAQFRQAFGELGEKAVLEHHSTFDDGKLADKNSKDKLRLASENWDMPVVVTTAVQFFESLFANRSSRCRKLHNITGSVIILDEAQMLQLNLLRPIMAAIDELARNYRCSVVMCTATQPAIHQQHGFYKGFENLREIAPNPEQLFERLARTIVQHIGEQKDESLLNYLTENPQILIIVNNRKHAQHLYHLAKSLAGCFHLSTLMCAKHRTQILDEIRHCLKESKPCRVISTSLIEAGVDVDFPLVMRAEAGLDSVAQAAGRCNREGKRAQSESLVFIFKPEEQWKPPAELNVLSACMRSVVRSHQSDLLAPDAILNYFKQVYASKGSELDKAGILADCHNARLNFPFETMAKKFQMIQSHLVPLIIPFNEEAEKLIDSLQNAEQIGGILRKLQPYTIQISEKILTALYQRGAVDLINRERFGEQFYYLINRDLYSEHSGLNWDTPEFIAAENCAW
ncbi:CRISPR-associated helicase Cas3' [Avibacterium endocarditidis]|uniref:CRISPR-associated helicase Cas3' n=1 Tax=Avibacterium endocarditidis TaxID=380674 RepID=UPI0039FD5968